MKETFTPVTSSHAQPASPVVTLPDMQSSQGPKKAGFMDSLRFLKDTIIFLKNHPLFIMPLVLCWVIMASSVLVLRYTPILSDNGGVLFFEIAGVVFVIAYCLCLANLMLLELMQQVDKGEPTSLGKALKETVSVDALKVLPLAILFALLWFVILLLRALTSKKKKNSTQPSPQDAARTLGGVTGNPFSWLQLGLSMLEKLVRMVVFLALPAIAWENKGSGAALKQAVQVVKQHPVQFMSTYGLTEIAGILMALPLVPIYVMSDNGTTFPDIVWYGVIVYEGVMWILGMYLEQMSLAMLYQWHLKWVQNGGVGELNAVEKPALLKGLAATA